MATHGIDIIVKMVDQFSSKFQASMTTISKATSSADRAMMQLNQSAVNVARGFGIAAAQATALYMTQKAFRSLIEEVDRYKLYTIGIAATLTEMTTSVIDGTVKTDAALKEVYKNNLAYAQETFEKVELEAAKWFASGKELIMGWQLLTQKGVLIYSDEDITNLGVIVDRVKLLTQGQYTHMQIAQEIRAVMSGQARAADQLGRLLDDRLGPGWRKLLEDARQHGKVLEFLAKVLEGTKISSGDIQKTWEAQKTTFTTLLAQIGRKGLLGLYEDMTVALININNYLRTHKDELVEGLKSKWEAVRLIVRSYKEEFEKIYNLFQKFMGKGQVESNAQPKDTEGFLSAGTSAIIKEIIKDTSMLYVGLMALTGVLWTVSKIWGVLKGQTVVLMLFSKSFLILLAIVAALGFTLSLVSNSFREFFAELRADIWNIIKDWELFGYTLEESWNRMVDFDQFLLEGVKGGLAIVMDWFTDQVNSFTTWVGEKANKIWEDIKIGLNELMVPIRSMLDSAKNYFGDFGETASQVATSIVEDFKKEFSGLITFIKDAAKILSGIFNDMRKDMLSFDPYGLGTGIEGGGVSTPKENSAEWTEKRDEYLRTLELRNARREWALTGGTPYWRDAAAFDAFKKDMGPSGFTEEGLKTIHSSWKTMVQDHYDKIAASELSAYKNKLFPEETFKPDIITPVGKKESKGPNIAGDIKKIAEERRKQEEELGRQLLEMLQREEDALARSYARREITVEDYYTRLYELAYIKYQQELANLNAEAEAARQSAQEQIAVAKTPQKVAAIQEELNTRLLKLEGERKEAHNKYANELLSIDQNYLQQKISTNNAEIRAQEELLHSTEVSFERKKEIFQQLLILQRKQLELAAQQQVLEGASPADAYAVMEAKLKELTTSTEYFKYTSIDTFTAIKQGIRDAADAFEGYANGIRQAAASLMKDLASGWSNLFKQIFKGELDSAEDLFKGFLNTILDAFSNILTKMIEVFIESQLYSLFGGLFGGLTGPGMGAIGSGGSWGNLANHILGEKFATGGTLSLLSKPVAFATGGVIDRPMLALMGEGRHKEALVPLPDGRAIPAIVTDPNSTRPIEIQVNVENKSSQPVKAEQGRMDRDSMDRYIVGVVLKDYEQGGSVWKTFRQ